MGVVYEARDTTLGRIVALKTFGAMAAIAAHERDSFEQRFLSEARISATLDDQHVVSVFDVGRDFDTGLLFMALEYVKGETLASALSRGPMPWEEAVTIVVKVARALQIAHSHHIVHRDIKPANIMLNAMGEPKIMDFGIAKASSAQLTMAGQVFGTPAYMSPEQASGTEVDGRSDVFSLGVVLYELVTNTRPFEGATMAGTLTKILSEEPRPASNLVDLPKGFDAVISRALRKDRDLRYDSASHLAIDLELLLEGKVPKYATQMGPLETIPARGAPSPRRTVPPAGAPPVKDPPGDLYVVDGPGKKSSLPLVGAITLAVILGGAAVLFLQRSGAKEVTPSVPVADPKGTEEAALQPVSTPPPTGAALPASTAAALSMESSGRAARVSVDLRHPFASGTVRIKVDERVVFASDIHGMPMKVDGVVSSYDGRFGTDLAIPPGDHVIQVEVRSGPTEFVESTRVQLKSGESRHLLAQVGKTLTLSFE
ncbi:MAG: serine/threonine protein kinase [Vicinamibacteria bacterium]|nr:serine/threonine protein kinase [Vicinamibacteria bacterium]